MAVLGLVVSHVLHRSSIWLQTALSSRAVFAQESSRESNSCPVLWAGKWLTAGMQLAKTSTAFSELISIELHVPRLPESLYLW